MPPKPGTGPNITVARKSGQGSFYGAVKRLQKMAAYVGVPAEKSSRKGEPINNAELLYIHSKGSPARRILARPVLEPAIEAADNKAAIAHELTETARLTYEGKAEQASKRLRRAALAGQNAARGWFTDSRNGWAPLAESTKKGRLANMGPAARRKAKAEIAAGGDPFTPLIDSGALRNAIVGITREDK